MGARQYRVLTSWSFGTQFLQIWNSVPRAVTVLILRPNCNCSECSNNQRFTTGRIFWSLWANIPLDKWHADLKGLEKNKKWHAHLISFPGTEGTNKGMSYGNLDYSIRLKLPMVHALQLFKEKVKANSYLTSNTAQLSTYLVEQGIYQV